MTVDQVLNHPVQLLQDGSRLEGRSGKLARVEEILEEVVAEGDRGLVFTQFAEMGRLLQDHLQGRFGQEFPFLHGGTPKRARDEMVAWFQSPGGPQVFILSLKAGAPQMRGWLLDETGATEVKWQWVEDEQARGAG